MSEKLPGNANMGNERNDELEELDVQRVSSEHASEESEVHQDPEISDEEFMPVDRVDVNKVEAPEDLSATDESVLDESAGDDSLLEESVIEESEMEEPAVEESVVEESIVEESGIDEPPVEEPVIETAVEESTVEEDVMEEATEAELVEDPVYQAEESEELTEGEDSSVSAEEDVDIQVVPVDSTEEDADSELDDNDEIPEDAVVAVPKYSTPKTAKPRVAAGLRNVLLVLLFIWIAFIIAAPFVLPRGLYTPNLDLLSGDHYLGTDSVGRDLLYLTLRAGQTTFMYTLIPTLVGFLGLVLTYRSWSDPASRQSRSHLMRPMPFTVISLLLSFGLGLYLPRSWVYFVIVAFLTVFLWLREAFAFARYLKAYRQAPHNQYSYYLGAKELDNIRFTYGQEMRAAFLNGLLNIFLRAYLIISVLPFTDNSLTVPLRADWASRILIPLQQGRSLLDLDILAPFIAWGFTLFLAVIILILNNRVANRQTVLSTMRMRANHWRAGDEV